MIAYPTNDGFDEFSAAKEQFEKLLGDLRAESSRTLEHGEVESLIAREGNELLRRLMQGYLDHRAHAELPQEAVVGPDGEERRQCRTRERELATLFGDVTVQRLGYRGAGLDSVFPLDAALNLPRHKYSFGLGQRVASGVAKHAFADTVQTIAETTGGQVPKRQSEILSRQISLDFDAFYEQRPDAQGCQGLLVMTVDGKGVVVRQEDLREATRKAAERSEHKLKTRLSRGEKRYRKRMATVAAVYEVDPDPRTAEQIMGLADPVSSRSPIRNKRVWASLQHTPGEVIEQLFAEAERRDPHHQRTWLVLSDGQDAQLREIQAATLAHRPETVIVQDFIHALEYLWKAAYAFHPEGSADAEAWVLDHALGVCRTFHLYC